MREYKKPEINDLILEIIRVILLRDTNGEYYMHFLKYINTHRNELQGRMTSEGAEHLIACENIILALTKKDQRTLKS